MRRRRWWGAGMVAAVAVAAAAGGGVWYANAGSSNASSFVPITPCRLLDTRPDTDNVGTRNTPLGPADTHTTTVWGTNGNCTIPTGATAISANIVAITPTAASFLTVWPADQPRPLAASLNWTAGQPPTPNAVTAALSTNGQLSLYNLTGTVHLAIDLVGYYEPSTTGPAGPAGPTGPAGPKGDPGTPAPRPPNQLWVAPTGGDYTTITAALTAIGTTLPAATPQQPYTIHIAPGTYTEPTGIQLENHVSLHGSGIGVTMLQSPWSAGSTVALRIEGSVSADVQDLTVRITGPIGGVGTGTDEATAIRLASSGQVSIRDVAAIAQESTRATGVQIASGSPVLVDVTTSAAGVTGGTGLVVTSGAPVLTGLVASGTAAASSSGVLVEGGTPRFRDASLEARNGFPATAIDVRGGSPTFDGARAIVNGEWVRGVHSRVSAGTTTLHDVTVTANGNAAFPQVQRGVYVEAGTVVLERTVVSVNTPAGIALEASGVSGPSAVVRGSTLAGAGTTAAAATGSTVTISSSVLVGGPVVGGGTFQCAFNVDEDGASLTNTCDG